jgi:hypothetical protein
VDVNEVLYELERGFWRAAGDREAYAEGLAQDALHVFPGWGIADRGQVLDGVEKAAPWSSFTIDDPRIVMLGPDTAALVYVAQADRGAAFVYRAAVTSVYRREGGKWRLVVHQQTPLG